MKYSIQTNSVNLLADLQTPVSIYLKIRDIYPYSVLLESADYHGGENSYSFIGFNPVAEFLLQHDVITETFPDGNKIEIPLTDSIRVTDCFQQFIQTFSVKEDTSKLSFNGLFGYFTFESVRYFEDIRLPNKLPTNRNPRYSLSFLQVHHCGQSP
jgi:anthranilate synthase component 1